MKKILYFVLFLLTVYVHAVENDHSLPNLDFFNNKDNIYFFESHIRGVHADIYFLSDNHSIPVNARMYAYYEKSKKVKEWVNLGEIHITSESNVLTLGRMSFLSEKNSLFREKYYKTYFYALESLDAGTRYSCVSFKSEENMMFLIQPQRNNENKFDDRYVVRQNYVKDDFSHIAFSGRGEPGKLYGLLARFRYNDIVNEMLELSLIDGREEIIFAKDMFEYLDMNPFIKFQKIMTPLYYEFIFEQNSEYKVVLKEIQNLDFEGLEQTKKLEKDFVIYNEQFYKKINPTITNKIEVITYSKFPNPWGFKNSVYYCVSGNNRLEIIQSIDKDTYLVNFTPRYADDIFDDTYALLICDGNERPIGFIFDDLLHYEGVFEYYTLYGNSNIIPKFRVIYPYAENKKEPSHDMEKDTISNQSDFFKNKNPYALSKKTIYKDTKDMYSKPKVLYWVSDGCLYDYSGYMAPYLDYDCIVHLIINREERELFFDENYEHYYKYVGIYESSTKLLPSFKVFFEKK